MSVSQARSRNRSDSPSPSPRAQRSAASMGARRVHGLLPGGAMALALVLAASSASAQQAPSSCPPGSWFCADTQEKPAAPPGQPVTPHATVTVSPSNKLEPLPEESTAAPPGPAAPSAPTTPAPPPPPPGPPPPPPVYRGGAPTVVYQPAPYGYRPPPPPPPAPYGYRPPPPPPYYYHPRPPKPTQPPREWGLNLHMEGAILGHTASPNSGMDGLGFGLRYKPVPAFGIEADLDFWGGRDYYGDRRNETAFSLNAMTFVNPRSKVQVYFLAGIGWTAASVTNDQSYYGGQANYSYFGGQIGTGLEFRLARHFALNTDVRGFIRGRTDSGASASPEFVDPATGRTSNTSGGGIVTGGMTFYF